MHHPPYSHDLAPSDYRLFPDLIKHLCRWRFFTDKELKYVTPERLKEQSELFYFTDIEKLWDCYKFCVDKGGDYIEK